MSWFWCVPTRPAAPDAASLPAFFTDSGAGGGLDDDLTFGGAGDNNGGLPAFFSSGGGLDDMGGLDDALDASNAAPSASKGGFLLTPAAAQNMAAAPALAAAPAPAPAPEAPQMDDWDRSRAEFARMQQDFFRQHQPSEGGELSTEAMLDDANLSSVFALALDDDDAAPAAAAPLAAPVQEEAAATESVAQVGGNAASVKEVEAAQVAAASAAAPPAPPAKAPAATTAAPPGVPAQAAAPATGTAAAAAPADAPADAQANAAAQAAWAAQVQRQQWQHAMMQRQAMLQHQAMMQQQHQAAMMRQRQQQQNLKGSRMSRSEIFRIAKSVAHALSRVQQDDYYGRALFRKRQRMMMMMQQAYMPPPGAQPPQQQQQQPQAAAAAAPAAKPAAGAGTGSGAGAAAAAASAAASDPAGAAAQDTPATVTARPGDAPAVTLITSLVGAPAKAGLLTPASMAQAKQRKPRGGAGAGRGKGKAPRKQLDEKALAARTQQWEKEHKVLGHTAKSSLFHPRQLLAVSGISARAVGDAGMRSAKGPWAARVAVDRAYAVMTELGHTIDRAQAQPPQNQRQQHAVAEAINGLRRRVASTLGLDSYVAACAAARLMSCWLTPSGRVCTCVWLCGCVAVSVRGAPAGKARTVTCGCCSTCRCPRASASCANRGWRWALVAACSSPRPACGCCPSSWRRWVPTTRTSVTTRSVPTPTLQRACPCGSRTWWRCPIPGARRRRSPRWRC